MVSSEFSMAELALKTSSRKATLVDGKGGEGGGRGIGSRGGRGEERG